MWGDISVPYVFVPGYPGLSAGAVFVFVAYSLVPYFILIWAIIQLIYAGTVRCEDWQPVECLRSAWIRGLISFLVCVPLILLPLGYLAYDITPACCVAVVFASLVLSAAAIIGSAPQRPKKISPFFWTGERKIFIQGQEKIERYQWNDEDTAWRIREMLHAIKLMGIVAMSSAAKWLVYVVLVPLYTWLNPDQRWLFLSPKRPALSCSTVCAMPSGRALMATSVFTVLLIENCMKLQGANLKKQDDDIERSFTYTAAELQKMGIVPITTSQFLHKLASLCVIFLPVPVSVLQLNDGTPEQVFVGFSTGILVALVYHKLWTSIVLGRLRRQTSSQSIPSGEERQGYVVDMARKLMVKYVARPLGLLIRYSVIAICVLKGLFTIGMALYGMCQDILHGVFSTGVWWRRLASVFVLAMLYAMNGFYVRWNLRQMQIEQSWMQNQLHCIGKWTMFVLAAYSPSVLSILNLQLEDVGPVAFGFTRAPIASKMSLLPTIGISGLGKLARYFVLPGPSVQETFQVQEKIRLIFRIGLIDVHTRTVVERQLSEPPSNYDIFALILAIMITSVPLIQFSWDFVLALLNGLNAKDVEKKPDAPDQYFVVRPELLEDREASARTPEVFTDVEGNEHTAEVVTELPASWPSEPVKVPSQDAGGAMLGFEFWNAGSKEEIDRLSGELRKKNQQMRKVFEQAKKVDKHFSRISDLADTRRGNFRMAMAEWLNNSDHRVREQSDEVMREFLKLVADTTAAEDKEQGPCACNTPVALELERGNSRRYTAPPSLRQALAPELAREMHDAAEVPAARALSRDDDLLPAAQRLSAAPRGPPLGKEGYGDEF